MKIPIAGLITDSHLLLELQTCLGDRYLIYAGIGDKDGMAVIDRLYCQLFGKGIQIQF